MEKVMKLKRFHPTFESAPVLEERYLQLQAETHRLKKELHSRDQQHKLLAVKLHRAQEAAKRNLRTGVEQGLPNSRDKNVVMTMLLQQSNAEERIHELEQKLREGQKDAQNYINSNRQSKAEIESLKKTLELSIRTNRRTRAPTPLDVSRRYEKMVKKLKNQILTLQEEKKQLHSLLSERPDDSRPPTSARLEVISQVGVPVDLQTKKARRHKQQDNINIRMDETETDGGCGLRNVSQLSPNGPVCQLQEQPGIQLSPNGPVCQLQEQPGIQTIQDSVGTLQITCQLMKTREDFDKVKKKYDRTSEELHQLKINHNKCLQKLQDTYSDLTQERKVRQELEIEKKQMSGELAGVQHLKSNLQQLRQQNVQLENENAELLNAALNVPRTNFAEIKGLREQLVEELKQRNLAVANASKLSTQLEDCKRDLARLAVVEANWYYLKTELEVANKSVATGNLKVLELQAANKLLQKEFKELQLRLAEIPEEVAVIYET